MYAIRSYYVKHVDIKFCEQGVVVEHLLEVRNEKPPVGRIAVKAIAQLIVKASFGHGGQAFVQNHKCVGRFGSHPVPKQQGVNHGLWEFSYNFV